MLSDEEKKAIEFIKSELEDEKKARDDYQSLTGLYGNLEIEILLNLVEKQSKEIEELKEKNRQGKMRIVQLENEITARIEDVNKYFTPNDKIKAKIEYYEKIDNPVGKRVLQSLLEKE